MSINFALAMGAPPQAFRSDGIVGGTPTMTERRNERQRRLDKSHTPILLMFLNDSPDGLSFLPELRLRADVATGADEGRDGNAIWIIKTIHPAKCSNGFFRDWGRGRVLRKGDRD